MFNVLKDAMRSQTRTKKSMSAIACCVMIFLVFYSDLNGPAEEIKMRMLSLSEDDSTQQSSSVSDRELLRIRLNKLDAESDEDFIDINPYESESDLAVVTKEVEMATTKQETEEQELLTEAQPELTPQGKETTRLSVDDLKVQVVLDEIERITEKLGDNARGITGLPIDSETRDRKARLELLKKSLPPNLRREMWMRDFPFAKDDCPLADMDLFLPLHFKDVSLASVLFHSIEKVFPCFRELIVTVSPDSEFIVSGGIPSYAKVYVVPEPVSDPAMGYIAQQVIKLYVDKFSTAKRVMILEADLVMTAWVDSCFLGVDNEGNYNGKVRTYCATWEDGGAKVWKKGIEHAIGVSDPPTMDCTVLSPFVYHVELFPELRRFIQDKHQKTFGEFIEDYFHGHSMGWIEENLLFSEFNILNNYMIQHRPDLAELCTPADREAYTSWTPKPYWSKEESWGSRLHCSRHFSGPPYIPRDNSLRNPKLSFQFFDTALHELDSKELVREDGRLKVTIDTSVKD